MEDRLQNCDRYEEARKRLLLGEAVAIVICPDWGITLADARRPRTDALVFNVEQEPLPMALRRVKQIVLNDELRPPSRDLAEPLQGRRHFG